MSPELLFVDDDSTLRRVLSREIEDLGYEVHAHESAEEALAALGSMKLDLALLDLSLPGMDGLGLMRELSQRLPGVPSIMLTGHGGVKDAVEAMRCGAYDFLEKPVGLDALEQVLARATQHSQLLRENHRLREVIQQDGGEQELLGEDATIIELRNLIAKVASSSASVLISGENGTGKELIARTIHRLSGLANRPFVVLNCGAVQESLFASELFGHEKGAFTGAHKKRMGLFEAAHGGTLLLDEVGELPREVQPQLLRALQFGEVRPVGSDSVQSVQVRVLSATNRNLMEDVQEGSFREDLYYRLAPLLIEAPALRDRPGDIRLLAKLFLERQNQSRPDTEQLQFAPGALECLGKHDWPGNVRELENALVRLTTLASTQTIQVEEVERHVLQYRNLTSGPLPTLDIEQLERIAIDEALERHSGNRQRAAAELGIAIKTLYNKMRRYSIEATGDGS